MTRIYATLLISTVFILSGCSAIYNWFDGVGQHFPVIGERCENWQCFTASGQEASRERIQQQQATKTQSVAPQNQPAQASSPDATAPAQLSPAETYHETSKNY